MRTLDGGFTWQIVSDPIPNPDPSSSYHLHFHDENFGFVASADGIFRTVDGGNQWNAVDLTTRGSITSIFFLDHAKGWAASYNNVFMSLDSGLTWTSMGLTPNSFSFIKFVDNQVGSTINAKE